MLPSQAPGGPSAQGAGTPASVASTPGPSSQPPNPNDGAPINSLLPNGMSAHDFSKGMNPMMINNPGVQGGLDGPNDTQDFSDMFGFFDFDSADLNTNLLGSSN